MHSWAVSDRAVSSRYFSPIPGFLTHFSHDTGLGINQKWHLFLLDFCYFANLLLLCYLWILNDEPRLLMMVFGVTYVVKHSVVQNVAYLTANVSFVPRTGPLAWAVMAFRNRCSSLR